MQSWLELGDEIFGGLLGFVRGGIAAILELANLFVDENGDHLTDEDGNRLGEY